MIVQIYAFTNIEQAVEAAQVGVDHIGFVAGRYGQVHGELSFAEARRLVQALPRNVRSLALTMATEVDEIMRMVDAVQPDIVHLSTDPHAVGLVSMEALRRRLPAGVGVMKAIPVENEGSIALAKEFARLSDYLLLDTKVTGMPGVGATGRTHDWDISRRIVTEAGIPVILAGGLTPENVREAIRRVQPAGVDANTGTNLAGSPVEKDMQRIRRFVEGARRDVPEVTE